MKAKRILPLLAAAALFAGCFKDVSYKTNYVLKPLAQAQTVDPIEPFEGLKAYAFDADTVFYTVASYEDALDGVIARKDDLSDRIASPAATAEPCVREGTVGWVQMPLSAETQMVVAVDPINKVYAYTQQELGENLPNLYVSLIFRATGVSTTSFMRLPSTSTVSSIPRSSLPRAARPRRSPA